MYFTRLKMKGKLFLILFITLPFYLPANFLHKAPALQKNVITLHNLENLKNRKKNEERRIIIKRKHASKRGCKRSENPEANNNQRLVGRGNFRRGGINENFRVG